MKPAGQARVERRLAAILAADVVGYSRLIEGDEEGTLRRLKSLRAEVIDPKIAEHRGRIVKTTGDGLLVEFASVIDALLCAAEVQTAMANAAILTVPLLLLPEIMAARSTWDIASCNSRETSALVSS